MPVTTDVGSPRRVSQIRTGWWVYVVNVYDPATRTVDAAWRWYKVTGRTQYDQNGRPAWSHTLAGGLSWSSLADATVQAATLAEARKAGLA